MKEIEEFYSYVEMPQVAENLKAWTGSFPGGACVCFMLGFEDAKRDLKNGYKVKFRGVKRTLKCCSRAWNIAMQKCASRMHGDCFIFCKVCTVLHILANSLLKHASTGTFAETTSAEHQLHWIIENCKVVRSANGLSTLVEAMKIAGSKHDLLWCAKHALLCVAASDP